MKKLLTVIGLTSMVALGAQAQEKADPFKDIDFSVFGEAEYAIEKETAKFEVGPDFTYNSFLAEGRMYASMDKDGTLLRDSFSLKGGYVFTDNITGYARVDTDKDFEYDDTSIGVSVRF